MRVVLEKLCADSFQCTIHRSTSFQRISKRGENASLSAPLRNNRSCSVQGTDRGSSTSIVVENHWERCKRVVGQGVAASPRPPRAIDRKRSEKEDRPRRERRLPRAGRRNVGGRRVESKGEITRDSRGSEQEERSRRLPVSQNSYALYRSP